MEEVETTEYEKKTTNVKCSICNKTAKYCIKFVEVGLAICARTPKCGKIEDIAMRICKYLDYKFLYVEKKDKKESIVHYICNKGHQFYINYTSLRIGGKCKDCNTLKKKTSTRTTSMTRIDCNCPGSVKGRRPFHCQHYNHEVCCPESAKYWSEENVIKPSQISPSTKKLYKWNCPRCGNIFPASPGGRCYNITFFCSSKCKIEPGQDLKTLYPGICELMTEDNIIDPSFITCGSSQKINLICYNHDSSHEWKTTIAKIVERFREYEGFGTPGCEHCNSVGFDQKYGRGEYFAYVGARKHNGFYSYFPEKYEGNEIKTPIFCPSSDHGIFYQTPHKHKAGRGCWKCASERKESKACQKLRGILDSLGIKYKCEKMFKGMKYVGYLRIDFYDKVLKIAFEYDGVQHFFITTWSDKDEIIEIKNRDICKDTFCLQNDIHMYRFCRIEDITLEKVLEIRDMCKPGMKQVYASYPHYIEEIGKVIDLSKYNLIVVQPPTTIR